MKLTTLLGPGLLLGTALGLAACVGGSGGTLAGIGGTGITATGTITGFGSIFVNGVEFETGTADIVVDDNSAGEGALQLGMVVTVTGTLDDNGTTGTASAVEYDDEVQGPVLDVPVDPTGDGLELRFTVLDTTVLADRVATVFDDGVTFETLAQGDYIEVSGFADQAGVIHATRIEGEGTFVPGSSVVEIKGTASNVVGSNFDLGSYSVDASAADLSDVAGGVIVAGNAYEVKGTLVGTDITATAVKDNDDLHDEDVDKASIEGFITDYVDDGNFSVAGQAVDASSATLEPTSLVLANGVEVEVEGPIVSGILQATKVQGEGGDVELAATVQSVSPLAGTVTLQYFTGTVSVHIDSQTSLRDDTGEIEPYTLADVTAGHFLEIEGLVDDSGNIVAREVRRHDLDDDVLQGPKDSCDGTSIVLFGVSFSLVNGTTSFEDENEDDTAYADAAAFCDDVNARNPIVQIKDEVTPDGIADAAEVED